MNYLMAKLWGTSGQIYKVMSQKGAFFALPDLSGTQKFDPSYKLEDDEWYKIGRFSSLKFPNELIGVPFNTAGYLQLPANKYSQISYFCSKQGNYFLFQKLAANQLLTKKWFEISDEPTLEEDKPIIVLNPHVDAVYDTPNDTLYFRDFPKLKIMFRGIEALYRTATDGEVGVFLANSFIALQGDYSAKKVKEANRKRIALAMDTLNAYSANDKKKIFAYISSYCKDVPFKDEAFQISTEEHLKKVLFGIEQRYYTTLIGAEKRLANSVQIISS